MNFDLSTLPQTLKEKKEKFNGSVALIDAPNGMYSLLGTHEKGQGNEKKISFIFKHETDEKKIILSYWFLPVNGIIKGVTLNKIVSDGVINITSSITPIFEQN